MNQPIRWKRSEGGFVESHCGRFYIEGLTWGTTRVQSYAAYYTPSKAERVTITGSADTMSEAKTEVRLFAQRNMLSP